MKNVFWSYGLEGVEISGFVALVGTFLTFLLGGWDKPLQFLMVLIVSDFVLGILSAIKMGKLNSKVMFWGGINKILVLLLVSIAVFMDYALPVGEPYIRTAVIFFYCGREGMSVIENYGKMGMPLPKVFIKFFEQLKAEEEKEDEKAMEKEEETEK